MNLKAIADALARALRPWVASDDEASEFANSYVTVMCAQVNSYEPAAIAAEMLTYRVTINRMACGDIQAAAACVARRYAVETARVA